MGGIVWLKIAVDSILYAVEVASWWKHSQSSCTQEHPWVIISKKGQLEHVLTKQSPPKFSRSVQVESTDMPDEEGCSWPQLRLKSHSFA